MIYTPSQKTGIISYSSLYFPASYWKQRTADLGVQLSLLLTHLVQDRHRYAACAPLHGPH